MNATRKVLVVDDDPVVGSSFERVLAGKGYAVIHASDGEEALERLARDDYDVVYTDIKMPGMSGLEVARRIKASRPWLPVVIVTGYGSEANEKEAQELGATAFLHKPLSPEMIEGSMDQALESAQAESAAAVAVATPEPEGAEEPMTAGRFLRNVGLFIVSPFVGIALLAWTGYKALAGKERAR